MELLCRHGAPLERNVLGDPYLLQRSPHLERVAEATGATDGDTGAAEKTSSTLTRAGPWVLIVCSVRGP